MRYECFNNAVSMMKEMNHWVKLLTVVMVGMFPPKQTRRLTGLGKTDLFQPVKGKWESGPFWGRGKC